MQAPLLDVKGERVGQIDLQGGLAVLEPSREFLHEYAVVYLANQRRGTVGVKTRSEVSGGGRKPWKQKHTGRARAGSIRSPLWRHGGVIHGPKGGKIYLDFPRQKARKALAHAIAAGLKDGKMIFVDEFRLADARSKEIASVLKRLGCSEAVLVVVDQPDPALLRAARNIKGVAIARPENLNAYQVLAARSIVWTRAAWGKTGSIEG